MDSETAYIDETGIRVEKSLYWFHVASSAWFTYLFVHKKRGKEALGSEESLLRDFQNLKGAQYYTRIQSFTSMLRKHSMNVFQNLIDAFDRKTILFQAV